MRKGLLVIIILLSFYGCQPTKRVNFSGIYDRVESKTSYSFNVAGIYEDMIYFINPEDNKLYSIDSGYNDKALFFDTPIQLFAFTSEYLLCVDMDDKLIIMHLISNDFNTYDWDAGQATRGSEGFSYKSFGDSSIIYKDAIYYITSDYKINCLKYDTGVIAEITNELVYLMAPYKNQLFFTIANNNIFETNTLMVLDLKTDSIQEIIKKYIYDFKILKDWIYYINDYSLYRFSIFNMTYDY